MSGEPWKPRLLEGLQMFYREANTHTGLIRIFILICSVAPRLLQRFIQQVSRQVVAGDTIQ